MPAKRTDSHTLKRRRERVAAVLPLLYEAHPDAKCSLDFSTPLELIVATILSAQCTDERVNLTTPALFEKFPTAEAYAGADVAEIEPLVQSCGFFRQKAKSIKAMAESVVENHAGEIPRTMDELTQLRGVGRKTANVVLGNAFGINVGITVDTHVTRLANRLGLTRHESDAVKIEQDLMQVVPNEEWTMWSHLLIHHGRRTCVARKPRCEQCVLFDHCPSGPKIARKREKAAN
ncbi:MAG: endonuclease III [Planctomycetota bacterium]